MPPEQGVRAEIAGRYRLRSEIGSGGMGTVWHAEDALLRRAVAVKEVALPHGVGADERSSIRTRVLREARAAAALNHANAVTVFDVIEEDGNAFIVMERITGRTLDDIVKEDGPLPDDRLIEITEDVLSALETAHRRGIVHRDVKPANVMVTSDGRTKLADFGIASVKDDPKITASGLILGSPSYMAPEQATHGSSGPEADLWGLGATLYFALEGVPPFDKQSPIPTLTAVVGDDPRPIQKPSRVAGVITALLAKDPARRPSPAEVRRMLDAARGSQAVTAPPTPRRPSQAATAVEERPAPTPTPRPAPERRAPQRSAWPWAIAAVLAIALVAAAAVFLAGRDDQPERNAAARPNERAGQERNEGDAAAAPAPRAEGWTAYEDPSIGYELSYPSGWSVDGEGSNNTYFTDPETGTYLQVGWVQPPNELGPVGAWEAQAEGFADRHQNYEEIRIDRTEFQGMDAAEWEFTYEDEGAQLHTIDLGFITEDESTGMALLFQTHEEDWAASQDLFEELKAGFRPPG